MSFQHWCAIVDRYQWAYRLWTMGTYLQRKNEWKAVNLNATNVAKTLTFFLKHEKHVESIEKKA